MQAMGSIMKQSWRFIIVGFVIVLQAALPRAVYGQNSEFDRELAAAKEAVERNESAEAISHFGKANELRQGKCSECYVWLARIEMAAGQTDQALAHIEQALATATSDVERSRAQLYDGVALARQNNLLRAEAAFRGAVAVDPACLECRFNLGFVLLKESKDAEGVQVLKTVASSFSGTPRGRELQRFIDDPSRVRKDFAPEFSATLSSGEPINLDTLKGKVVLLDFWGTWCKPCLASLPLLKDLAANVDPRKVAIVSIDEDEPKETWERFVQSKGMNWAQVYDGDRALSRAFSVDGFPRYVVLSKDGIILAQFKGWSEGGESTIKTAIGRALMQ
jgi:thioredoxin-like negative regulator of GroEL